LEAAKNTRQLTSQITAVTAPKCDLEKPSSIVNKSANWVFIKPTQVKTVANAIPAIQRNDIFDSRFSAVRRPVEFFDSFLTIDNRHSEIGNRLGEGGGWAIVIATNANAANIMATNNDAKRLDWISTPPRNGLTARPADQLIL